MADAQGLRCLNIYATQPKKLPTKSNVPGARKTRLYETSRGASEKYAATREVEDVGIFDLLRNLLCKKIDKAIKRAESFTSDCSDQGISDLSSPSIGEIYCPVTPTSDLLPFNSLQFFTNDIRRRDSVSSLGELKDEQRISRSQPYRIPTDNYIVRYHRLSTHENVARRQVRGCRTSRPYTPRPSRSRSSLLIHNLVRTAPLKPPSSMRTSGIFASANLCLPPLPRFDPFSRTRSESLSSLVSVENQSISEGGMNTPKRSRRASIS